MQVPQIIYAHDDDLLRVLINGKTRSFSRNDPSFEPLTNALARQQWGTAWSLLGCDPKTSVSFQPSPVAHGDDPPALGLTDFALWTAIAGFGIVLTLILML